MKTKTPLRRLLLLTAALPAWSIAAHAQTMPAATGAPIAADAPQSEQATSGSPADPGAASPSDDRQATPPGDIVVTGTFIRSNGFKPSSPVDVLSATQLATRAPTNLGDQLATLPFNQTPQGSGPGLAAGGGTVNTLNLRGLGPQATLVLLNGQRVAPFAQTDNYTDLNTLVPDIMIRNIEVLKDGASALYGSDAVAGVVNVLTKNSAEGLELSAQRTLKTEGGEGHNRFGAVFGSKLGENTHIVFAAQYDQQELITYDHIPALENQEYVTGALAGFFATPGSPGVFSYVQRNAAGQQTGATRRLVDPLCGTVPQSAVTGSGASASCSYYFPQDQSYVSGERRIQLFTHAEHKFDNGIAISLEGGWTNSRVTSDVTASGALSGTFTVPYTNPGIPASLLIPAVNSLGQQLYAVPNPSNPTQPLRNSNNRVVLTSTPTVAASGVPFYEDLTYSGRTLGSQCGLPTQGNAPVTCGRIRQSTIARDVYHMSGSISGELAGFSLRNTFNYSEFREEPTTRTETGIFEFQNALRGLGGPGCNVLSGTPGVGPCSYFNPFGSAIYATPGSAAANTQDLIDFIMPEITDRYRTTLMSSEGVATGNLFNLPAGPLGIAIGYQVRKDTWSADYDAHRTTADVGAGFPSINVDASRTTTAFFGEIAAPLIDGPIGKLNLNAALRHESAGGSLTTTDPKVGLIYTTNNDMLTLRGSYGTSFLAPTLLNMYATTVSQGTNVQDPLYPNGLPRPTTITQGNRNLSPQTSRVFTLGGIVRPLRGLRFDVTYFNYQFRNLLVTQNAQQVINASPRGPAITRDPITDQITTVILTNFNAASLQTQGFDLEGQYHADLGRFGTIALDANASIRTSYKFQSIAGAPVVDLLGGYNNTQPTNVYPAFRTKLTTSVNWQYGPGSLTVTGYYSSSLTNDRATSTTASDAVIPSYSSYDMAYSLDLDKTPLHAHGINLSLGLQNMFDRTPPVITYFNSLVAGVYDYRGRLFWLRVNVKL